MMLFSQNPNNCVFSFAYISWIRSARLVSCIMLLLFCFILSISISYSRLNPNSQKNIKIPAHISIYIDRLVEPMIWTTYQARPDPCQISMRHSTANSNGKFSHFCNLLSGVKMVHITYKWHFMCKTNFFQWLFVNQFRSCHLGKWIILC